MDDTQYNELAGRIEGVARAVLLLADTMKQETCMDGPTLTRRWRDAVEPQADAGSRDTARRTLHGLAQALDEIRSRHQQYLAAAMSAIPPEA